MAQPLGSLSPAKQNARQTPLKLEHHKSGSILTSPREMTFSAYNDQFQDAFASAPSSPQAIPPASSPSRMRSPVRFEATDFEESTQSPADSSKESTATSDDDVTTKVDAIGSDANNEQTSVPRSPIDEGLSTMHMEQEEQHQLDGGDETELTLSLDDRTFNDETVGDLSTISAIPTDLTRLANLSASPTRPLDGWSPSKQLRNSQIMNPGPRHSQSISQRPLQLVSRPSISSADEGEESTPCRSNTMTESPTDLLNFTGQSNIFIPPPESAPRTARRSPSGRGAFPIRINPSPTHRSQASMDREKSSGRSPHKSQQSYFPDRAIPVTPADARRYAQLNGLGMDLLDIDLEPMATPRSIPSVTPRELETLRSELQSRISGLEATLSGKEAEVLALTRSITDAEVRVGKTSEDLRNERAAKEDLEREKTEMERQTRTMEGVLREVKQNAFVEAREREKMTQEIAESERRLEEGEIKILELTASLETLRDERVRNTPSPAKLSDPSTPGMGIGVVDVDAAVKQATESVARELHALYKGKHERKVADLKISYEKRWFRKVEALEEELKKSQEEVLKLQTEKDATMSGVIAPQVAQHAEKVDTLENEKANLLASEEKSAADRKVLQAHIVGLEEETGTLKNEIDSLRKEVEQERLEKGDLVAQVDLFLTMSEQEKEAVRKPLPVSPPQLRTEEPLQYQSPSKASKRQSLNGVMATANAAGAGSGTGRVRPMSMLKPPGKMSGIPAPGGPRPQGATVSKYGGGYGGGRGIIEGIAKMGAGGR